MSADGARGKLTAQQTAVLDRVGTGLSNSEIAAALSLAPDTVKRYLAQAFECLGVEDRVAAFARAWQSGDLPHAQPVTDAPLLSDEQLLILRIWAAGGSRSHVATVLNVSKNTASRRERGVLAALGTRHRAVAVRGALEHRLINPVGESLADLCTTPTATDSGQGRTHQLHDEETNDATTRTVPPVVRPGLSAASRFEEVLRSASGLIVHLGALAGLPPTPALPEILLGRPPLDRTPAVVRLVHQALALRVPCVLVIPPGATNPVSAVSAAGLACAWSSAVRQGAANPSTAYAAAAHQLGTLPAECVVVCTGDQAPVAAQAGPGQVLTTASTLARTRPVPRRPPPALTSREQHVAELTARGYDTAHIAERLATGEHLVSAELAALRHRFAAADDTQLIARMLSAELLDTRHLRAELPDRPTELDQAERAVLALLCAGSLTPERVRAAGLTWREAHAAEACAVQALSSRRSRVHAVAVALITGAVTPPLPPTTTDRESAIRPTAPHPPQRPTAPAPGRPPASPRPSGSRECVRTRTHEPVRPATAAGVLQRVQAPHLPAPGSGPIVLLAGAVTGQPNWQHRAVRLLAECGFTGTVLDPYVPGDTELPWRTGWLNRAEGVADVLLAWRPLGPWAVARAHRAYLADRLRPPVVVGCPPNVEWQVATRHCLAVDVPTLIVHSTLASTAEAAITRVNSRTRRSR
ncbi:LuxR C-terminal-related transcriptional regulator [Kitasatospora cineracea]|uniref:LuxR C-terminal-related transcriptional regulator n=1 Tax=Kitasatospora cineracea TaxID=88074 RepID=UPI0013C2F97F|nr:LuxR C-terminal-related transcriptional regulator [Kitasatospora cineracea]